MHTHTYICTQAYNVHTPLSTFKILLPVLGTEASTWHTLGNCVPMGPLPSPIPTFLPTFPIMEPCPTLPGCLSALWRTELSPEKNIQLPICHTPVTLRFPRLEPLFPCPPAPWMASPLPSLYTQAHPALLDGPSALPCTSRRILGSSQDPCPCGPPEHISNTAGELSPC